MRRLRTLCWFSVYNFTLASFLFTAILPTAAFGGPMVQITQPGQGQVVSGQIWIDVSYSTTSSDPIKRLEIFIDGTLVKPFDLAVPESTGTKSFQWDFTFASATTHSISAKAIDTAGASGMAQITVTVRKAETVTTPGTGDVIPPTVNIYYPAQGAKLSGPIEIRAEARDNVGVQQVYFYIDGRLHKMLWNSPPYYAHWDTQRVSDGPHVLSASAVDASDNEARSAEVTVFVENHAMTRMDPAAVAAVPPSSGRPVAVTPAVVTPQPTTPTVTQFGAGTPVVPERPTLALAPTSPAASQTTAIPSGPIGGRGYATSAPRSSSPGSVLSGPTASTPPAVIVPTVPTTQPIVTPMPTAARPVAITPRPKSTGNYQGGLSVVRSTPTIATPAARTQAPTEVTTTAPASPRPATLATMPVPPTAHLTIERPAVPPTIASAAFSSLPATPATDVQPATMVAYSGPARISTPATVRVAEIAPASTPAPVAGGAGTEPMLAMARPEAGGQRIAAPQRIDPRPITAISAADFDAALPTVMAINTLEPLTRCAANVPQRTSLPDVAAGRLPFEPITSAAAAADTGAALLIAMMPTPEAPVVSPAGVMSNPGRPDVGEAIAHSPVKDIGIVYNGKVLDLLAAPETVNGLAIAPLRELFEQSDGLLYWFPVTKEVRAFNATTDLHLTIGNPVVDINGSKTTVTVAPYIKHGRTMLPLQFLADMMDLTISYDALTKQVVVTSNDF